MNSKISFNILHERHHLYEYVLEHLPHSAAPEYHAGIKYKLILT